MDPRAVGPFHPAAPREVLARTHIDTVNLLVRKRIIPQDVIMAADG